MDYFDYLPSMDKKKKDNLFDYDSRDLNLEALKRLAKYKLTFLENIKLGKQVEKKRNMINKLSEYQKIRLGVIGNFTLSHLKYSMMAAAFKRGILLDITFTPFDSLYSIALRKIQPFSKKIDYFLIYMSPENYYSFNTPIDKVKEEVLGLVNNMKQNYHVPIILTNYHRKFYDNTCSVNVLNNNNFDAFVEDYNNILRDIVKNDNSLLLFNLKKVADFVGFNKWFKPEDYYRSKIPFAYENSDIFSDYFARFLAAYLGKRKKIIVLDLDGVLWGGILSDKNIILGNGSSIDEAFMVFQRYLLKELYETGIVLTIVSKNNLTDVIQFLDNSSQMILKKEHFAMLQVNWQDKVSNIKAITDTLNVGLDSIVFIDDNIYERNLIREKLPLVTTLEIGNNPFYYPTIISNSGCFDYYNLSKEDLNRTHSYIVKAKNVQIQKNFSDYNSYLKSLNMTLIIESIKNNNLTRIVQLINKTNQFNLMSTRVDYAFIEELMKSSNQLGIQVVLKDKYEDYGIISNIIISTQDDVLSIDCWVMSCRVFNRDIEDAVINYLYQYAKQHGMKKIIGKCKNIKEESYVKELYSKRGFCHIKRDGDTDYYESYIDNFNKLGCAIHDIVIK
ncbi:HAD family hydrolase [Vallitalea sediminicola]